MDSVHGIRRMHIGINIELLGFSDPGIQDLDAG